jgi:hypothetical protein
MKVFSLVALIAATSAIQLENPAVTSNFPGAILSNGTPLRSKPSAFVDDDFIDGYKLGNSYIVPNIINGNVLAQSRHETRQRLAKELRASLIQSESMTPGDVSMLQIEDEICETVECAKQ